MVTKCPCCNGEVTIKNKPVKWQGEKDKVIITYVKWQESWRS